MDWVIERTVELPAAPDRVWRALTDPNELAKWFPDEAVVDLRPGGRGSLTWHNHGSGELEVVEVDAPHRFVWRWQEPAGRSFEEFSTTVEWTLTPNDQGGTTLHVKESGFDTAKHFEMNSSGWTEELQELVDYIAA